MSNPETILLVDDDHSVRFVLLRSLLNLGYRVIEATTGSEAPELLQGGDEIDLINHDLWSSAPYQKGAQYLREVAGLLGEDALDAALAEFYQANVGKAARMRDLVTLLKSKGSASEIEALTVAWLETETCPAQVTTLCP